jgi:hypothetical protein
MITWDESLMAWFTSIDMAKSSSVTHIEEREDVWVALRKLNHCRGFSPSRISCSKLIQMGLADVLLPRWCRKTKGARGRGTREQNVWASVCVWRVKWSGPGLRTAGRRAVWSSESGSEGSKWLWEREEKMIRERSTSRRGHGSTFIGQGSSSCFERVSQRLAAKAVAWLKSEMISGKSSRHSPWCARDAEPGGSVSLASKLAGHGLYFLLISIFICLFANYRQGCKLQFVGAVILLAISTISGNSS